MMNEFEKNYNEEVKKYFNDAFDNLIDNFTGSRVYEVYKYQSVEDFAREGYIGGWFADMFSEDCPCPDDKDTQKIWDKWKKSMRNKVINTYFPQWKKMTKKEAMVIAEWLIKANEESYKEWKASLKEQISDEYLSHITWHVNERDEYERNNDNMVIDAMKELGYEFTDKHYFHWQWHYHFKKAA